MLKESAGKTVDLPHQARTQVLVHQHCEAVREVYNIIHTSGLDKFTFSWIDTLLNTLNAVLYELDRLPEAVFKELIEAIVRLSEARNELRLARFLFDVEEIKPVHRLILRNRAVLRSEKILQKVLRGWPLQSLIETP